MDRSLLQQSGVFSELDDDELDAVARVCGLQKLKFDEYVFREGDEGDRLYIIAEGAVRISRNVPGTGEEALTVLKKGACFGEMAIMDQSTRSTDAIVDSRCTLLTVTRSDFDQLVNEDRELGEKLLRSVIRLLCARLRATNDSLQSILVMAMF